MQEARTDDDRKEIQERRRQERARRKQNQKDKMDALLRQQDHLAAQNRQMAEQLARLQNNDAAAKLNQLDLAIKEAADAQQQAMNVHANAVAKADGTTAAKAMEFMLQARDRVTQLSAVKDNMVQQATRPAGNTNPVVTRNATVFAQRNKWYKGSSSNDQDSKVMTMLDTEVAREGFDPATPAYWQELEARAKRYIPHRFSGEGATAQEESPVGNESSYNGSQQQRKPRSPVGGAGDRGNRPQESEGGFKLSSERVKAMKEAGIWDDPVRRQKMISKYRELDNQNS